MATARITGGYGNAPGYGRVTNPKPKKSSAWGGLWQSYVQPRVTPTFTAAPAAPATSPVAAAAAAAPGAGPKAPAPGAPDVRDSTFNTGVAGLLAHNKQQRDDLGAQGTQATEDFNTMLSRLADNRAQSLMAQNYGANKQGLFYSGQLGKRRDETNKGYDQQQSDSRSSYDRANAARNQALDRLGEFTVDANSPTGYAGTGQAGLDLSDLLNQAVGRQTTADANGGGDLAAASLLGGPSVAEQLGAPEPPPPAATSSSAQKTNGVEIKIAPSAAHGGKKWVYHRGASGQWIPVRPA